MSLATKATLSSTAAEPLGSSNFRVNPASVFDALPDNAFIRESQLVQSPKRPGAPAPLPFSAPTLWRKVKAGTFPKPHRLSLRVTAWKVGEVRTWINQQTAKV
jgi:prophage regulatory protein